MRLRITRATCLALLVSVLLSACGSASFGQIRSSYPNIQVSQGNYPGYASPFLAVNPRDPRNLLGAAWFRQTKTSVLVRIGTFVSFDGGTHWHENGLLPVPPGYGESVDETIAFNTEGTGFVTAVIRQNQHDASPSALAIWQTNDGGRHFTGPLLVETGNYLANPWIAIDRSGSSATGLIALAWKHGSTIEFSRSTDNGQHFTRPVVISSANDIRPNWPIVLVGEASSIHVVYLSHDWLPGNTINEAISTDQGQHFQALRLVLQFPQIQENNPALLSSEAAAVDPRDGTLYLAFEATNQMPGHTDLELISSRDNGHSWSVPVFVTHDPASDQVTRFQPQIAIQANGTVDIFYLTLSGASLESFLVESTTRGASFGASQPIADQATLPSIGGTNLLGERQGLAIGGQNLYPFWSDIRNGVPQVLTALVPTT